MALPLIAGGAIAAYRIYKLYKAYKKLQKLKQAADAARRVQHAERKVSKAVEAAKKARRFSDKKKAKQKCPSKDKCPLCGHKKHDKVYVRNLAERRKALLRDANDPNSGLGEKDRRFIRRYDGKRVPPGYEVSHEKPLYTLPPSKRCTLDKAWNMKSLRRSEHRQRHKKCGDQFHDFPRSR